MVAFMNERMQNPHPFDMSSYFKGLVFVLGGVDRPKGKRSSTTQLKRHSDDNYKLDWSFLKKNQKEQVRPD